MLHPPLPLLASMSVRGSPSHANSRLKNGLLIIFYPPGCCVCDRLLGWIQHRFSSAAHGLAVEVVRRVPLLNTTHNIV